jgi:ribosomal protein S18 acetylase RimI-like enzyme
MAGVAVRTATQADLPALANLDLTYSTSRVLLLERSGMPPEITFAFRWRQIEPREALYNEYSEGRLRGALDRVDLFLSATVDERPCGLLMIMLPTYTNAGEITDLAVDRAFRRRGAGRALLDAAVEWAKAQSLRALWVEPRADNEEAIEFYVSRGFRASGFNDRLYSNADHEDGRPTLYMYLEL